jgi:hypothetical protein
MRTSTTAVDAEATSNAYPVTVGAALYRDGRFRQVVRRLERAGSPKEADPTQMMHHSPAYWWHFLVMAHERLGHAGEARL